jgi:hypothetical protein
LRTARIRRLAVAALAVFFASLPISTNAQQAYVGRYDAYVGFADINSPALGLNESGFHVQAGINPRRWYSIGGDYSIGWGSELLTTNLLPAPLQAQIDAEEQELIAAHELPAGYQLTVPTDAFTETFAFGPQLDYRHFSRITLFVRPSLGALRERATPHPNPLDTFQSAVVASLAPAGYKLDYVGFYGVGGGGEFALSQHVSIRAQMDVVYNHPFNDILANGRWTFRYSVGPSFHFGKNTTAGK